MLRVKFGRGVVELLRVDYREITLPPYWSDSGYVASQTWRQEGGNEAVEELPMSFTISLEVTFIIFDQTGPRNAGKSPGPNSGRKPPICSW